MYLSRIQLTTALLEHTQLAHLLHRDNYGIHQLLWDIYPDGKYLFREENSREQLGTLQYWPMFYVLSLIPPKDDSPLFQVDCKPFKPSLNVGDRLAFHLRANPTIARRQQGKKNSARHDVVMDAKYQHLIEQCLKHNLLTESEVYRGEKGERRSLRNSLNRKQLQKELFSIPAFQSKASREVFVKQQREKTEQAAFNWLEKKAQCAGFKINKIQATGYLWNSLAEAKHKRNAGYSSLDYQGTLKVTDVDVFISLLAKGFGSAKRFGCGLMLIRRI